jgi:hypothetical protein
MPSSLYHPRSAEALAAARERREEKKVERAADANPHFADKIRAEGAAGLKRGRKVE